MFYKFRNPNIEIRKAFNSGFEFRVLIRSSKPKTDTIAFRISGFGFRISQTILKIVAATTPAVSALNLVSPNDTASK